MFLNINDGWFLKIGKCNSEKPKTLKFTLFILSFSVCPMKKIPQHIPCTDIENEHTAVLPLSVFVAMQVTR